MNSKLPYSKVIIQYKDLSKTRKYKNLYGNVEFNKKNGKYEILIDKKSSENLQQLTKLHELVHCRREHKNYVTKIQENETEIEAIARTPKTYLNQAEGILHDYLIHNPRNSKKPLNPNNPQHLIIILKRIKKIVVK